MSTTTSILNDLIEILKDGKEGFSTAAQDIGNPELKSTFNQFSTQREQFATQLQTLARDFGDKEPANTGSVAGAIHRGWIDLKSALASHDEHAILAECERGEDAAVSAYRDALQAQGLPAQVTTLLNQQFTQVQAAHDQVKALRDARAK